MLKIRFRKFFSQFFKKMAASFKISLLLSSRIQCQKFCPHTEKKLRAIDFRHRDEHFYTVCVIFLQCFGTQRHKTRNFEVIK